MYISALRVSVLPPVLVPRQTTELPRERPPLPEYTRPENTTFPTQEPTNSPFHQLPGGVHVTCGRFSISLLVTILLFAIQIYISMCCQVYLYTWRMYKDSATLYLHFQEIKVLSELIIFNGKNSYKQFVIIHQTH